MNWNNLFYGVFWLLPRHSFVEFKHSIKTFKIKSFDNLTFTTFSTQTVHVKHLITRMGFVLFWNNVKVSWIGATIYLRNKTFLMVQNVIRMVQMNLFAVQIHLPSTICQQEVNVEFMLWIKLLAEKKPLWLSFHGKCNLIRSMKPLNLINLICVFDWTGWRCFIIENVKNHFNCTVY